MLLGIPRPTRLYQLPAHFADEPDDISKKTKHRMNGGSVQEGLEPPTGGFGDRCSTNLATDLKLFTLATTCLEGASPHPEASPPKRNAPAIVPAPPSVYPVFQQ